MSRFRAPVRAKGDGFVVELDDEERAILRKLVRELRELLTETSDEATALLGRLFPVAYPDDEEAEAEYQRLMREELVASKLAAFASVEATLDGDGPATVREDELIAFMQSVNAIRLVLGTMLGVTDDPDQPEVSARMEQRPEYALYGYLSYLLDSAVRALSGVT